MAFWDDLLSFLPSALASIGGAAVGAKANSEAAKLSKEGLKDAADITSAGIDKALGIDLDTLVLLKQTFGDRFQDVVQLLQKAPADYRATMANGLKDYAATTRQGASNYGQDLMTTANATTGKLEGGVSQYGEDLAAVAKGLGMSVEDLVGKLDESSKTAAGHLTGLEAAGNDALGQLKQIAGADPSKLTLSQQRQLDELKRTATSRLAASGLRGAGRAGVATLNDADASFRAKAEDENRARTDRAVSQLFTTGAGASSNLAGLAERTGNTGFNAGINVSNKIADLGTGAAGANFDISKAIAALMQGSGEKIASNNLTTQNDIGAKNLATTADTANKQYTTDQNVVGQTGDFYDRLASLIGGEGTARKTAATGTASAQAAARQGTSVIDANAGLANANLYGGAGGALAGIFARAAKPVAAAATSP